MSDAPRVSVIIPCYNQAHFLAEAIDSVLRQDHAPAEIVVVDDGSTDRTPAVAGAFPSVRCLRQENRGLAAARNAGFARSTGEFVVFLDADDRLLPGALAIGAAHLTEDGALGFTAGFSRYMTAAGEPLPTGQPQRAGGDPYAMLLRRNSIRNPAMVMFRRSALERAGGFDGRINACADYDMYLRVSRARPVRFHETVVAEYRRHAENMSLDAAVMLRQLLAVLGRQRPWLDTAARREACRDGRRNVRAYYGERLANQIRARVRARTEWSRLLADVAALLRHHPAGALRHLFRKASLTLRPGDMTPPQ